MCFVSVQACTLTEPVVRSVHVLTGFVVVVSTVCLPSLNGSTSGVSESADQVSNPVSVHVDRGSNTVNAGTDRVSSAVSVLLPGKPVC